ncbi:MAG: alanine racemase, partial [Gemmatimonadota bacterium]|nr:alanine racemase [Gemmatimonadota bacterium]
MDEIGTRKADLDTPVLWVDLDRLENNIRTVGHRLKEAGVDWRPHIKGVKIPAIAHMLLKAGAIGVTCAKLGEAEVMAAGGVEDVLIANQVVGPPKYIRLARLCRQADVKVAVDSDATLEELGRTAVETGVEVGVLVELNTGMERAGVRPGEPVVELARKVHQTPGLRFRGVMAWEGHACVDEDSDWKHGEIRRAVGDLVDSAQRCRAAGLPCDIVSGGGSGTLSVTPDLEGITEIQAGGAIFNDVMYTLWGVRTD